MLVAQAAVQDVPAVARLFARAFVDDEVVEAILPGTRDRPARLARVFAADLRAGALATGAIDIIREQPDGPLLGAAAWEGPDGRGKFWRDLRELPNYVAAVGPAHLLQARRTLARLGQHRPTFPHWYLADIAAAPDAQGRGVGSALLKHRLAIIDGAGLPGYLQATTPDSERLYQRHGFVSGQRLEIAHGYPVGMTRAAVGCC
ncbi:MAG: GNAT family N-acetyltransferase [Beutenbergiaceae bacterium]